MPRSKDAPSISLDKAVARAGRGQDQGPADIETVSLDKGAIPSRRGCLRKLLVLKTAPNSENGSFWVPAMNSIGSALAPTTPSNSSARSRIELPRASS